MYNLNNSGRSVNRLEVFHDGQCPLCRREIEMLKRWNTDNRIEFTDIAGNQFHAERQTGLSLNSLMGEIHARILPQSESVSHPDTKWITGIDVFREIYSRFGFKKLVWMSHLPVVSNLLQFGYRIFAYFRYQAAKRRLSRANKCVESCKWERRF